MPNKSPQMTDALYDYMLSVSLRDGDILRRLREETARLPNAVMQIPPEQGQFLALMVRLIRARKALEVGVFTGYSGLAVALALPADGRLIACDISEEYTAVARRYWQEAGVAGKIDLRLGPALETLDGLLRDGHGGSFDFAFVDADKGNYAGYYERILQLLRPGGLMAIDNVLWSGRVADPENQEPDTVALRKLNAKLRDDERVDLSLVPIADGLTLVRKREEHDA